MIEDTAWVLYIGQEMEQELSVQTGAAIYGRNRILHSGGKTTLAPPLLFDLHGMRQGSCLCEQEQGPPIR